MIPLLLIMQLLEVNILFNVGEICAKSNNLTVTYFPKKLSFLEVVALRLKDCQGVN